MGKNEYFAFESDFSKLKKETEAPAQKLLPALEIYTTNFRHSPFYPTL